MISKNHSNRGHANWLIYNISDYFLEKFKGHYKGVLYDLGCGESPYKDFFLNHADRYVGVDWEGSLHRTDLDVTADLNKPLAIDGEVADTVISLSVMEHLYEPQVMLDEAFRILKPGGRIVLQVPWQWHIHEEPFDFFRYTPYGLKYMFEKAGFKNIEVEAQSGFFSTHVLKMNYFSRRFLPSSGLLKWLVGGVLLPFWYAGQVAAPWLDRLDKNWAAETTGYFVTASKTKI